MQIKPRILVLDNDDRYLGTYWFGRWFRRLGCRVSTPHFWFGPKQVNLDRFDALVITGSVASATQNEPWILAELDLIEAAEQRNMPVLGVCFGLQLLGRAYFGKATVRRCVQPEIGWYTVNRTGEDDPFFAGVPAQFSSYQHHEEQVMPQPGMKILASSEASAVQAFRIPDKPVWGTQFHFEVTPQAGRDLLRKCRPFELERHGWHYEERIAQARLTEVLSQLQIR
ncbi:MAG: type 1 glutamine amidotransferase [Anaerolineae bacterium]